MLSVTSAFRSPSRIKSTTCAVTSTLCDERLKLVCAHRSAYPPNNRNVRFGSKADLCSAQWHVCFGPKADRRPHFQLYLAVDGGWAEGLEELDLDGGAITGATPVVVDVMLQSPLHVPAPLRQVIALGSLLSSHDPFFEQVQFHFPTSPCPPPPLLIMALVP